MCYGAIMPRPSDLPMHPGGTLWPPLIVVDADLWAGGAR